RKQRCSYPECAKPYLSGGKCRGHGGGYQCRHPGCTNLRQQQNGGKCCGHGGGQRCSYPGCTKLGRVGSKCCAHGGRRRCSHPGCSKYGIFHFNLRGKHATSL
ncbi:hypothetical protein PHYSODRAFT_468410, partial [Phytophthora sojae]